MKIPDDYDTTKMTYIKGTATYHFREACAFCGEPFLGRLKTSESCSSKCAKALYWRMLKEKSQGANV